MGVMQTTDNVTQLPDSNIHCNYTTMRNVITVFFSFSATSFYVQTTELFYQRTFHCTAFRPPPLTNRTGRVNELQRSENVLLRQTKIKYDCVRSVFLIASLSLK